MKKIFFCCLLLIISLIISFEVFSLEETRLLRFPNEYNDTVVFSYAGDLYLVPISGGVAKRLTSHSGFEMFARFSPDGKTIAFTAQYDGNTEVYLIPKTGGEPKRITFTATLERDDVSDRMGPNNIVMSWTNDGKNVVYRSRGKSFNDFKGQLFLAPIDGGMSSPLPFSTASWCSYSPDGKKLAMNRVFREFRTWKYYKGGMADDIWIFDFKTKSFENITENPAQDIFPMWYNDKIYFISDRDRIMNLFVYDTKTKETKKLTNFTRYDIKFPSLGTDKIIFENGGYIYYYDLKESKIIKLFISIQEDFSSGRSVMKDVSSEFRTPDLSPDGNRLVLSARGEIFNIPVKQGIIRNITNSSGAHDRNPVWSPDGKYIAYISDKNGEYQIFIQSPDKPGSEIQLTNFDSGYIYSLKWSPDSKKILFHNKKLELNFIDIETKIITTVHQSSIWEINNYNWSPDNNWIAFSDKDVSRISKVWLYNIPKNTKYLVTSEWFESFEPVFSSDGKYLFFVSNRDFNPIYSSVEWNVAYKDMSRIYFVTLSKLAESPFTPKDDKVFDPKNTNQKSVKKTSEQQFNIDIDNIENRTEVLPMPAGNFYNLFWADDKLFYLESRINQETKLSFFDFKTLKTVEVGNFSYYKISFDGKKILLQKDKNIYVTDLPSGKVNLENPVNISPLNVIVDLKSEWYQIFSESWRQMRDYFYDPGLHKVDWHKQFEKYAELLPYVNDRHDLNYIIGEMIGELNAGHAYVGGGDRKQINRIKLGLLGAEFEKDKKSGYFKILKIYKGENWYENLKSPLQTPDNEIKEGDFIISINGLSLKNYNNIYELLIDQANKTIEIEINSKPSEKDARTYLIRTTEKESELIYYNWVRNNIEYVNLKTNGQVGYIHIPDMSVVGLNEFVKHYYPQLSKKALIIDDRGNGGGNVSPMLIERLRREMSMMVMSRDIPEPNTKPGGMLFGPKVLLIDQYSASDGDLFPYQFRRHRIGPIVGVRSWGGVIGIRGSLPFVDGGQLFKPEFAHFDETGWIIEGHGVDPDFEVQNDPHREFNGIDDQLDKAIEIILQELEKFEKKLPPIPQFPDKSGY
ncbi:MAG TPA: PDZ domain-containing protein [Bacteroidales bacterium]|nr:PDZ domain-containing protein [Bacteroidales bacterium]HOL97490.1 PDZ domain-containing protein [Bacteroidales bacterium]HOM35758.1 PDZ domain-containing protein [Bacteroidales bacterium]HPD23024.1 PDZ domain-containing protein [Bacteroidales bacterium]HRS98863.1 PDZ domain-containing protein [Bacteroidales bacterium]